MINKLSNSYILFFCSLLCILVFFPIIQTGFTTTDDTSIAIDVFNISLNAAIDQGRIGQIPMLYLFKLPYLMDNDVYFQSIRIGFVLLTITLFSFCVFYLLNSYSIAMLSAMFCIGFLQDTWDHNLITSYPVALQCPLEFLFLSLIFFKKYVSTKKLMYGNFSAVFYFCAMFNELFVFYFPFFFMIQYQHSNNKDKLISGSSVRETLHETAPIIIATVLYLLLYAIWRWLHPSTYTGNMLYLNNISKAVFTIFQLSISSLPGYYFFSKFNGHIFYGFHQPFSILGFMDQMRVEWIVKAVILFWATTIVLYRVADEKLHKKKLLCSFFLCSAAIFLPNILLGFTSKYQDWVYSWGVKGYVTTYYSFFATICAIALLITYSLQFVKQHHTARMFLVLLFAITASSFSFITDYSNFFVTQDKKLSHIKWKVVDKFLQTPQFEMIPDGSVIWAPTLYDYRGIVENHPGYWSAYINRKTGKNLKVLKQLSENETKNTNHLYFLKFQQEFHSNNQFLVFAKMEQTNAINNDIGVGHSVTIFSYSINKIIGLIGFTTHGNSNNAPNIFVNDLPVNEKRNGTFAAQIDLGDAKTDFPAINIRSDSLIYLNDFIMTYSKVLPNLLGIVLEFNAGWAADEVSHRWSVSKSADINFFSNFNMPKSAFVEFTLGSLKSRTVKIVLNSILVEQVILSPEQSTRISLKELTFNPGKNTLKFETDVPPALPGNGDTRALSFAIGGIQYGFE